MGAQHRAAWPGTQDCETGSGVAPLEIILYKWRAGGTSLYYSDEMNEQKSGSSSDTFRKLGKNPITIPKHEAILYLSTL